MFGAPAGDTALTAASNSSRSRSLSSTVVAVASHSGKPAVSSAISGNFASCDAPAPRRKMTLLKSALSSGEHEGEQQASFGLDLARHRMTPSCVRRSMVLSAME